MKRSPIPIMSNTMTWSAGNFDAEDAGIDSIIERFDRLAKKWAPWPRKPKATI